MRMHGPEQLKYDLISIFLTVKTVSVPYSRRVHQCLEAWKTAEFSETLGNTHFCNDHPKVVDQGSWRETNNPTKKTTKKMRSKEKQYSATEGQ